MRKAIFFLLILLVPLAFAKTETTKVLHFNESATVYGKTLTTLKAGADGKVKVNVDGIEGIARGINRTVNINEMWINMLNFTYVDSESFDVIFEITVHDECGDKSCNITESKISCCTDCGCNENLKCINNICQKEACTIDWDCDDDNPCTVDKCSTTRPKTCSNTLISQCFSNDTCCPSICGPVNDTDCKEITVIKEPEKVEKNESAEDAKVAEPEKKVLVTEKEKGILIVAGVALLVIIIGFFVFAKK